MGVVAQEKPEAGLGGVVWTPHPLIAVPTSEQGARMGAEALFDYFQKREARIRQEVEDPYRFGFEPKSWERADRVLAEGCKDLLLMGSNRSNKTEFAAKRVCKTLVEKAQSRAWCFHTTGPTGVAVQHPRVYKYIPKEWKAVKKSRWTNVSFSQKGGFTESTFVLPNRSQCWFRNYQQDLATVEGEEVDIAWCDELVPLDWLETILFRLATRNGILIVTFTPVDGWTPTVNSYLQGAKTLESVEVRPLLPPALAENFNVGETVPLVQQPVKRESRVVYFHGYESPWGGWEQVLAKLDGANRKRILERAFGVATRAMTNRFPRFNEEVHVVDERRVRAFLSIAGGVTWYQVVDPCSGRNWFMTWAAVDPSGRRMIVREWPQEGDYIPGVGMPGVWAQPGKKHDGEPGPAQESFGMGLDAYRDEIKRVETELAKLAGAGRPGEPAPEKVDVFERIMDSRYGNAATLTTSEATTLIDQMAERYDFDFIPAPGSRIHEGIDMVNDALDYDEEKPVVPGGNEPKLYIAEWCTNTIYSAKEWTGADGEKGACKDPADNLRYLELSDPCWVGGDVLASRGGGAY